MYRVKTQTITLSTAVGNAVCASQTPLAAGALTIDGANAAAGVYTAALGTPRHLTITTGASEVAKTFTIIGTDRTGAPMTYSTVGASSATTTIYPINFQTITSITVSAATAAAVTIGFAAAGNTGWIPLEQYSDPTMGIGAQLTTGAGLTFTMQTTMADLKATGFAENDAPVVNSTVVTGTASAHHTISLVATGIRFLVNGWSAGGVTFAVLQKQYPT